MPSASTARPLAASAAIESSLCERTMPGSVHVAISSVCVRSIFNASRPSPPALRAPLVGPRKNSTPAHYRGARHNPQKTAPWGALLQSNIRRVNCLRGFDARSGAELHSRLDGARGDELARGELLALAQLRAQHFDASALRAHLEAALGHFHHLADFSLDGAKGAHGVLACIENLQLGAAERAPGAGRGI